MKLSKRTRDVLAVLGFYAVVVLMLRFSGGGIGWPTALLLAVAVVPLAMWTGWLRRRMTEQAAESVRRRVRPWPEERRRS